MVYLQLLNLSDAELDIFCRHMGHKKSIHLEHYRQMSALIERVYLTKMFIIQDLNLTNKFKNKNLKDIDIKGEISSFFGVSPPPHTFRLINFIMAQVCFKCSISLGRSLSTICRLPLPGHMHDLKRLANSPKMSPISNC